MTGEAGEPKFCSKGGEEISWTGLRWAGTWPNEMLLKWPSPPQSHNEHHSEMGGGLLVPATCSWLAGGLGASLQKETLQEEAGVRIKAKGVLVPGINPQLSDSTGKGKVILPCESMWCHHWICFPKFLYHFPLRKLNSLSVSDGVFLSTYILLPQRLLNTSFLWMEFQSYQPQLICLCAQDTFTHSSNLTFFRQESCGLISLGSFRHLFSMFRLHCVSTTIVLTSQ